GDFSASSGVTLNATGSLIASKSFATASGVGVTYSGNLIGSYGAVNLAPGSSSTLGINVTMNTAQASTDPTIYGVNVSATTGVDGTTAAYGVRATASGGDTNYSGYFYGSLFQVDGNSTPDTGNTVATAAGDVYVTSDLEVDGTSQLDGHVAVGGSATIDALDVLSVSETLACTGACSGISSQLTNTEPNATWDLIGGDFSASSGVTLNATGSLIASKSFAWRDHSGKCDGYYESGSGCCNRDRVRERIAEYYRNTEQFLWLV
ncbi:MAG: hypothetical protein UY95_C0010G0015, partial [Parcubacteria group bacterium GW2011_GWA2_56_7]